MKTRSTLRTSSTSRSEKILKRVNRNVTEAKLKSPVKAKTNLKNETSKLESKVPNYSSREQTALNISESTINKLCTQLSKNDTSNLFNREEEAKFVTNVLRNTLENNDSNSLLVCGARGIGKSALVEHCLSTFDSKHYSYRVIRLNGYLHNIETVSVRHIAKELDIEAVDLPTLSSSLKSFCAEEKEKLIFILDLFDIFCRKHQSLLYNLFDTSQQTGNICTIGITTRLDCVELLEKRVKSRMNQRIINLSSQFKTEDEYLKFAEFLLEGKVKVNGFLRQTLLRQYSTNRSVRCLKHALITFLLNLKQKSDVKHEINDPKLDSICSLSYLNLSILFLAFKFTQSNETQTFNCFSLLPLLSEIPTQMNVSKRLLMKAMDELIEYGFIVKNVSTKSGLYLSEWTTLSLAIDEIHVKAALTKKHNLPLNVNRLLTTLQ